MTILSQNKQILLRDYAFLEIVPIGVVFRIEARNINDNKIVTLAKYTTREVAERVLKSIHQAHLGCVYSFVMPQDDVK